MYGQNSGILAELQAQLEKHVPGQASFDPYTRVLYSTDGSVYQIQPVGVVFPRTVDDLQAAVEIASHLRVPILPRGAGTSLAGQAVGAALVLDCARHLHHIRTVDADARVAEVEPGVVCTALNQAVRSSGLMFGPDPASADRATVGGMIGNNATGAHSIRYGMAADHIASVDVILSDGSQATFGPISLEEAATRAAGPSLEAQIYRHALEARVALADDVRARWPHTWRRASGYGLNYVTGHAPSQPPAWYLGPAPYLPSDGINLAPLLAGSEGTLAIVRHARLRLVPRPAASVVVLLGYESVAAACDDVPALLGLEPSAVELIPRALFQRAATIPAYARKLSFLTQDSEAWLAVEFQSDDSAGVLSQAQRLAARGLLLEAPEAQSNLWGVRKVGLGLLMSVRGSTKPTAFVEDVAVPVERLGEFVRAMERVMAAHSISGEWYGHASAGCLHLRPLLNLKTADGVAAMQSISAQTADLVVQLGGAMSGEHGDGLSRTRYNEQLFGPRLMQAFRELKHAFDPHNVLNPGKVVPSSSEAEMPITANLRYGADYRAQQPITLFQFRREGDLAHAVEDCVGAGVCRQDGGVMCPSYQATRDEQHLTRGRANALRAALSGVLPPGALTSRQMYQVFDLCLECKGCKAECPTGVDIARVKAEFLSLYQAEHGTPLRSRFFAEIHRMFAMAAPMSGLVNWLNQLPPVRQLLQHVLGISAQRTLPKLAGVPFTRRAARRPHNTSGEPVVLFVDTYTEFIQPELGLAAMRVLEQAGCSVLLLRQQACCGRPMISKGLLREARHQAARNLEALAPYAVRGIPIVGLEPSCLLTLRDEYVDFFPDDLRAHQVAAASLLIEEFLTRPGPDGLRRLDRLRCVPPATEWLLHSHCYTKALVGSQPMLDLLRGAGFIVREIQAGCCGMAGSFGYEAEHESLSRQIAELYLAPAVRSGVADGCQIAAAGISCRTQIYDSTRTRAVHPIEALSEALISTA